MDDGLLGRFDGVDVTCDPGRRRTRCYTKIVEAAAGLYPLMLDAIETGAVVSWVPCFLLQTVAGLAAAAGGQWEQAETHYQTALSQAHQILFRSEQPEVRRW